MDRLIVPFDPGVGANDTVRTLAIQPTGRILVGGSFTTFAGGARGYLARLNPDGSLDTTFLGAGSTGGNGPVFAIALQQDGKIIVGGDFTTFNGVTRNRITRIESDEDPVVAFARRHRSQYQFRQRRQQLRGCAGDSGGSPHRSRRWIYCG